MQFRVKGQFKAEFEPLREDFIIYIIGLLKKGKIFIIIKEKKKLNPKRCPCNIYDVDIEIRV